MQEHLQKWKIKEEDLKKKKKMRLNTVDIHLQKKLSSLLDNLERSKEVLKNDESLKDTNALKKMLDHFDIINKDLIINI